ncbi:MAG: dockerin type I domain-containing protein [Defluviitaleaceae bacterium]|nr:dockerin type I domain-containing protein [Defluviitaleaceae bacterium]
MTKKMMKKFVALMVAFIMLSQSTIAPVALSIRSDATAVTVEAYDGYAPNDEYAPDYEYDPGEYKPDDYDSYAPDEYKPGDYTPDEYDPGEYKPDDYTPDEYDPDEDKSDGYKPDDYDPDEYKPDDEYDIYEEDEDDEHNIIVLPAFPALTDVDSLLRVSLFPTATTHVAGEAFIVFLSAEYSNPNVANPPAIQVRISIRNHNVMLPEFNNNRRNPEGHRFIDVFLGGSSNIFTLIGEDGDHSRYREIVFYVYPGAMAIPLTFLFPNGTTYHEILELVPISDYELSYDSGMAQAITLRSTFGWNDVSITHGAGQFYAVIEPPIAEGERAALDRDIVYQIYAQSQNRTSGSVFTDSFTLANTIMFPAGFYVVGSTGEQFGQWADENNNVIIRVADEPNALITPIVVDGGITGFEISLTRKNEITAWYSLTEIDDVNVWVYLYATNISINTHDFNQFPQYNKIVSTVYFTAVPVVYGTTIATHASNNNVYTTIAALLSDISSYFTSATPGPVAVGSEIEYTIRVRNDGLGSQSILVVAYIPAGTVFERAYGNYRNVNNGRRIEWVASVPPQDYMEFIFYVEVDGSVRDGANIFAVAHVYLTDNGTQTLSRTLNLYHTTSIPDITAVLSTDRVLSEPPYDFTIVRIGETITYTVTVNNDGLGYTAVDVTLPVPAGTRLTGVLTEGHNAAASCGEYIVWSNQFVSREEARQFTIIVEVMDDVTNGFIIANTARVQGTLGDMLTNIVYLRTPEADVHIKLTAQTSGDYHDRVRPREQITYTVTLDNRGEGNAMVNVAGIIPPGTRLVDIYGNQNTWTNIFVRGDSAVSLHFTVEVYVRADNELLTSRAMLDVLGTQTFSYDVYHRVIYPVLEFEVTATPPSGEMIRSGGTVTYTITVRNHGGDMGVANINATIPEGTGKRSVFLGEYDISSSNMVTMGDYGLMVRHAAQVPAMANGVPGTIEFILTVNIGSMAGMYRIEQITFVNDLNSQMTYHLLPLPIVGQGKTATVYERVNGTFVPRTNNVFEIEEGGNIVFFDPYLDELVPFSSLNTRYITYVFEGDYILYTITVRNFGAGTASMLVTDNTPFGTTICPDFDMSRNGVPYEINGRTITWDFMLEGAYEYDAEGNPMPTSKDLQFKVRVNDDLRNGFNIANQANVNGEATNRVDLFLPLADVRIIQTATTERGSGYIPDFPRQVQPVGLGEVITYTLTLTNHGLADGNVRVRNQLPPGVIFRGVNTDNGMPEPALSGITSTTLTWENVIVPGLAGVDPDIPAIELTFYVEVYGEDAFQELVNLMMGRDADDSGYGDDGDIVYNPRGDVELPDGVNINDTEEIFNFAVLSDLVDGRNDMFSNTVRHMVVRPIFSFTFYADPAPLRNIDEVTMFGRGVEEGDTIYYFIDIANSGHDSGVAIVFAEIPALTTHLPNRAFIIELDAYGYEIEGTRIDIPSNDYFGATGRPFVDKNGNMTTGIVLQVEVPYQSVLRFAFAVEVGQVYDGFRIECTTWINRLRSRSIFHYSPIPRVTIARSASVPYAHARIRYSSDIPYAERNHPNLWPNTNLVPFPWGEPGVSYPSSLSNGIPHQMYDTYYFCPFGPTVVRPGEQFTYYITIWSESSRSVINVVDVLPLFVRPIPGTLRAIDPDGERVTGIYSSTSINRDTVPYQGIRVPRYTLRWNRVVLPRTTQNMNAPVVLAVDVVVQVPQEDMTFITAYAKAIGNFRRPDGSWVAVDSLTNPVEHIIVRGGSSFSKSGVGQHRNGRFVQPGERIDYVLHVVNEALTEPNIFNVTDTLHHNLVYRDNRIGFYIGDTITATIFNEYGYVKSINYANPYAPGRTFITPGGQGMPIEPFSLSFDSGTRTITWSGGLKPGERVEMHFSAVVNYNRGEHEGNLVINYGVLNNTLESNRVIHTIVTPRVRAAKWNDNPQHLLAGDVISYEIEVYNIDVVTAAHVIVLDRLSEHTTFVAGSDVITGGLSSFRYGGSNAQGIPFGVDHPLYNPDEYFQTGRYLAWIVTLGPEDDEETGSVSITYDVVVNDRLLDGTVIENIGIILRNGDSYWFPDRRRPDPPCPWNCDCPPPPPRPWYRIPNPPDRDPNDPNPRPRPWRDPDPNIRDWIPRPTPDPTPPPHDPDNPDRDRVITPRLVSFNKFSTAPWDGVNEETRTLNWHYPANATVVSSGEEIIYFIELYLPPGSLPANATHTSRFVNVIDPLPALTVRRYEDRFIPGDPRTVVGHTTPVAMPTISWSDQIVRDIDGMGFDGTNFYWNFVEVPYGVTVTLSFSVMAAPDLAALTLNRYTQLLLENRAYINHVPTNSVFHEIARPAIVGEMFVGIVCEETGEREWVQTVDWFGGYAAPGPDEQIFVNIGDVFPFKIALGNAGYGDGTVMLRNQVNNLFRVVDFLETADAGVNELIPINNNGTFTDDFGNVGTLNVVSNNLKWVDWDGIRVPGGTAYIVGRYFNMGDEEDPRTWIHRTNDPTDASTTVAGLTFTIVDPTYVIFYVQVVGDPDQGQQIPNHAVFNFPFIDLNEMAGMGRTNQVDVYVQRTLLVARQEVDIPALGYGAEISNELIQGRVVHGDLLTYTIEVANAGGAGSYVEIAIPIPQGMEFTGDATLVPCQQTPNRLIWRVYVPAAERGRGMLTDATGQVVIGYVDGVKYIGIGSVAGTHGTHRLMPWSEAGRASVTFTMQVAEHMLNGSRIDSTPFITEDPALMFDIPQINLQPISVYPAVLSHFVPLAEIYGVKEAHFNVNGVDFVIGRRLDGTDFATVNDVPVNPFELLENLVVEAGTQITYILTARNVGLVGGDTIMWSQIPLHTEFVYGSGSEGVEPDSDNVMLWNVRVPARGIVTREYTVTVGRYIANGVTIQNVSMIAGQYTNTMIFRTLMPNVTGEKRVVMVNGNPAVPNNGQVPVRVGDTVQYEIILRNEGAGVGITRVEDIISLLLHDIRDITHHGAVVGDRIVWEGVRIPAAANGIPGEERLVFTATVGFAPGSGFNPPEQDTLIPNEAIFNNAVQTIDEDVEFDGEIGLGLGRTNTTYLIVNAPVLTATQTAAITDTNGAVIDGEVLPGDEITYTITVTNAGMADGLITLVVPVPQGTSLPNGADHVRWENEVITVAEGSRTFTFTVRVNDNIPNGAHVNSVPILTENHGANGIARNIEPAAITHHVPLANISGYMTADVETVTHRGAITYTITLQNAARVRGYVTVIAQVPTGTDLDTLNLNGGVFHAERVFTDTINGGTQTLRNVVVWENVRVPEYNNGYGTAYRSFTVTAQNLRNGTYIRAMAAIGSHWTNIVDVRVLSAEFEGVLAAAVNNVPHIYGEDNTVQREQVITYIVTVQNIGAIAGPVTVSTQIPQGTTLVSSYNNVIPDENGMLTWTRDNMPARGTPWVIVFQVRVNSVAENGTLVRNNATTVNGELLTPAIVYRVIAPVLSAAISFEPMGGQVYVGQLIEFTVEVTNSGDLGTSVQIYVPFPNGMVHAFGGTNSAFTVNNVNIPVGSTVREQFTLQVGNTLRGGSPIPEGHRMETTARVSDNHAADAIAALYTNTILHTFTPQMIYPGIRLHPTGGVRLRDNGVLTLLPQYRGSIQGAERTDGVKLAITVDNIGGSLNTMHMPMQNYTVRIALAYRHRLDERNLTNDFNAHANPVFIRYANGVEVARIPINTTDVMELTPGAHDSHIIEFRLYGNDFYLAPGEWARIELFTYAQHDGNADPLNFLAHVIPNYTQSYNPSRVVRGVHGAVDNSDVYGLSAAATVFVVGIHTMLAHIAAGDARGDAHEARTLYRPTTNEEGVANFTYVLEFTNTSPGSYTDIILIGRMPHVGDRAVINNQIHRRSQFNVDLVRIGDMYVVNAQGTRMDTNLRQYANVRYMRYAGELTPIQWNNRNTPGWLTDVQNTQGNGQTYRIDFGDFVLPPGATIRVKVEATAQSPIGDTVGVPQTAWKSFAFQYSPATLAMRFLNLRAEVASVGVEMFTVAPAEPDRPLVLKIVDEDGSDTFEVEEGDEFIAFVRLENNPGLNSIILIIDFDENFLTLQEVIVENEFEWIIDPFGDELILMWFGPVGNDPTREELLALRFEAASVTDEPVEIAIVREFSSLASIDNCFLLTCPCDECASIRVESAVVTITPPSTVPVGFYNQSLEPARPMDYVYIEVLLHDNPGVAYVGLTLDFDERVLELVDFVNRHMGSQINSSISTRSVTWENNEDAHQDNLFAARFRVANNSHFDPTATDITISQMRLVNDAGRELPVEVTGEAFNFEMHVFSGDVDFSGVINSADVMLLQQLVLNRPGLTIDRRAADTFQDRIINMRDVQTLQQFLIPNSPITSLPELPPVAANVFIAPFNLGEQTPADIRMVINPTNIRGEYEAVVSIANNPGIAAYHLVVAFDNTVLTPVSITYGNAFANNAIFMSNLMWVQTAAEKAELNEITVAWNAMDAINEDGVLFTVRFVTGATQSTATTLSLYGIEVIGHDLTNDLVLVDIATNLCNAAYNVVITVNRSQENDNSQGNNNNQGGNNQGGNNQGGNNQGGNNQGGNNQGGNNQGGNNQGGNNQGGNNQGGNNQGGNNQGGNNQGGNNQGGNRQ